MLSLHCSAAADLKLLLRFRVVKAFCAVNVCCTDQRVPPLPRIDSCCTSDCLPARLNHLELPSPLSRNVFKTVLPTTEAAAYVFHSISRFPIMPTFPSIMFCHYGMNFAQ